MPVVNPNAGSAPMRTRWVHKRVLLPCLPVAATIRPGTTALASMLNVRVSVSWGCVQRSNLRGMGPRKAATGHQGGANALLALQPPCTVPLRTANTGQGLIRWLRKKNLPSSPNPNLSAGTHATGAKAGGAAPAIRRKLLETPVGQNLTSEWVPPAC